MKVVNSLQPKSVTKIARWSAAEVGYVICKSNPRFVHAKVARSADRLARACTT